MRRALVTGAAGGIGRAVVDRLLATGHTVEGIGRRAETLKAAFGGGPVEWRAVDVADGPAMAALSDGPPLDVVVINAGICQTAPMGRVDAAEVWRRVLSVNLDGAFHTANSVTHRLREGGRVIAVSSGLGHLGRAEYAAYAASKHGLLGLVRSLALEWAPRRITVNAVCPGWVDTAMAQADAGADRPKTEAQIPLGRWVDPDEVAALILWLASPEASIITGQAYNISGGEFS